MTKKQLFDRCIPNSLVTPFVERHGRFFQPQFLPRWIRRGRFGVCFANAFRLLMRHDMIYVEGYAISTGSSMGNLHAWCVDRDGNVYDPTWKNGDAYFGIPFKSEYVKSVIAERIERLGEEAYFGILDDYPAGWPLVREHG